MNCHDDYLPPAWHIGGASVAPDLSNLTYWRLIVHAECKSDFAPVATADEVRAARGDPARVFQEKLRQMSSFWTDAARGWTSDYFASEIVFGRPLADLGGSTSERPIFGEVNASLPDPEARDPEDPGHEQEMRSGFSINRDLGFDVFVGTGSSLRRPDDLKTSRFDFRHGAAANFVFLDGHVDGIRSSDAARLEKIHWLWDHAESPAQPPDTGKQPP